MGGWRLAKSLEVLREEVRALHPGTRVDTIGNEEHAARASDHNPNNAGVVCAADFFDNAGLDLYAFSRQVANPRHPAVKYVIYNRQIWSKARAGEGWRRYSGDNPHTSHVHVSVGVGPDGRSVGPYDDTSPWGLEGGGNMLCKRGDKGAIVEALQYTLIAAGFDPGPVDGDYGAKTSAAVLAMRKADGSKQTSGDAFTGAAYSQLLKAVARRYAGRDGQPGPAGPAGPPGPAGVVDYGQLAGQLDYRALAAALVAALGGQEG